jgi:hypothetical protein
LACGWTPRPRVAYERDQIINIIELPAVRDGKNDEFREWFERSNKTFRASTGSSTGAFWYLVTADATPPWWSTIATRRSWRCTRARRPGEAAR